mmetsp:Transcript_1751/g.6836  ORF Transcript_1751/g.6836 Transcript_1751/m.6836 type:complete len:279 (+) Transcript_1751:1576-2412(+)
MSPVTWDPTARSIVRSHARVASPTRVLRSSATHAARSFSKSSVTRLATARHVSMSDSPSDSTPTFDSSSSVCPGRRRLSSSGTASATAFAHSSRASLVAPAETNAKESFEAAIAFRNLRSSFSPTCFRCACAMGLSVWTSLARSSSRLATLTLSSKYCASSSYPRSAMIACAASFNPRPGAATAPSGATELMSDASSRPSHIAASLAPAISSHLTVATITLCAGRSRSLSPITAFHVSRRETTRPLAGTLLPSATGHRVSRRFGSAKRPYRALASSMN